MKLKRPTINRDTLRAVGVVSLAVVGLLTMGAVGAAIGTNLDRPAPQPTVTVTAAPPVTPLAEEYVEPTAADFQLSLKTLSKQCFGEKLGCNLTVRVEMAALEVALDPAVIYEVTYKVKGAKDPTIGTLTVQGTAPIEGNGDIYLSTKKAGTKLSVEVTEVSAS